MAEPARQEPGCIEYRLHRDNDDLPCSLDPGTAEIVRGDG